MRCVMRKVMVLAIGVGAAWSCAAGVDAPAGARTTPEGWFAPPQRPAPLPALPAKVTRAFAIPIREAITKAAPQLIRHKVAGARAAGAQVLFFDLDCKAGDLEAALAISAFIKSELTALRTVCYVRSHAVSAGAPVAMACDELVMVPVGRLGGCVPDKQGAWLADPEWARMQALLRADLKESAERRGCEATLADAMVRPEATVFLVRHAATRRLRALGKEDWEALSAGGGDKSWQFVRVMVPPDAVLLMASRQAYDVGFADAIVAAAPDRPWANLSERYGLAGPPTVLDDAWRGKLADLRGPEPTSRPAQATTAATQPDDSRFRRLYPDAPQDARFVEEGWFARPTPEIPRPLLPERVTKAYVIPIRGVIDDTMFDVVRRKVLQCKAKGAELVVFDMDTPGGMSGAMEQIIQLVLDELRTTYTVAYVNTKAWSAGALIALGCTEIVMAPGSRMGAAMGMFVGPGGPIEMPWRVRAKFDAAGRADVVARAKQRGYSPILCEAMVSVDVEAWLIRRPGTGELRFVNPLDWPGLRDAPATTRPFRATKPPEHGWEFVRVMDGEKDLLAVTVDQARFCGFTDHVFASMGELGRHYGVAAEPEYLGDTWSEKLVAFLNLPLVSTVLVVLGLMAMWSEARSPGLGIPAVIAVACFAVLLGGKYLIGMAQWWEIVLFLIGLGLLGVEIFITPGFGVLGITGIVCCLVGLLAMVVPNAPKEMPIPRTALDWSVFGTGVTVLAVGFVISLIGSAILMQYMPKVPVARKLVLAGAVPVDDIPRGEQSPLRRIGPGDVGTVAGTCRPVGTVRFGDDLVDAVAQGAMIERGGKVRVLRVEGNRVIVERAADG